MHGNERLRRDRLRAFGIAIAAAAAISACGSGDGTAPEIRAGEWSEAPADPSLRVLATDPAFGPGAMRQVVRSGEDWSRIWDEWQAGRYPPAPLPDVDFADEMVLVAAMGSRPSSGYGIMIDSLQDLGSELVAHVRTLSPASGCVVLTVITRPAVAVAAPASDVPVRFAEHPYVHRCDD